MENFDEILNDPIIMKDTDHFAVYMYLVLLAKDTPMTSLFMNQPIILAPGQVICPVKSISEGVSLHSSKVIRIMDFFIKMGKIGKRTSNLTSLFTIVDWKNYIKIGKPSENQKVKVKQEHLFTEEHPMQKWIREKCPQVAKLNSPLTYEEAVRIKEDFPDTKVVIEIFTAMQNRKTLLKDYTSANLTFREWAKRREKSLPPETTRKITQA